MIWSDLSARRASVVFRSLLLLAAHMLVSMTGFGSATTRESGYLISSEIKSVNGRYLKTSIKLPDGFTSLEMKIDELLRSKVARGSVNLTLRITREASGSEYEVNFAVLRRYLSETLRFMRENADLSDVVTQGTIADICDSPASFMIALTRKRRIFRTSLGGD